MDELLAPLFCARKHVFCPSPPNLRDYIPHLPPDENPPQTFQPEDMVLIRSKRTIDQMTIEDVYDDSS